MWESVLCLFIRETLQLACKKWVLFARKWWTIQRHECYKVKHFTDINVLKKAEYSNLWRQTMTAPVKIS